MKKILAILFCFIYLASSAGIHVKLHYCSGKLKAISLTHSDEADCCGKMMKKKKNCCQEKTFSYQVKDNQKHADKAIVLKSYHAGNDFLVPASLDLYSANRLPSSLLVYIEPPDVGLSKQFIANRVLRI